MKQKTKKMSSLYFLSVDYQGERGFFRKKRTKNLQFKP